MKQRHEMKTCYICRRAAFTFERDHFPRPQSLGGVEMYDICRDCHDIKDRHPLDSWKPDFAFNALIGVWERATPEERLVLAKMFHILSQGMATINKSELAIERAAVVAYLLAAGTSCDNAVLAEAIERGEHRREESG